MRFSVMVLRYWNVHGLNRLYWIITCYYLNPLNDLWFQSKFTMLSISIIIRFILIISTDMVEFILISTYITYDFTYLSRFCCCFSCHFVFTISIGIYKILTHFTFRFFFFDDGVLYKWIWVYHCNCRSACFRLIFKQIFFVVVLNWEWLWLYDISDIGTNLKMKTFQTPFAYNYLHISLIKFLFLLNISVHTTEAHLMEENLCSKPFH